MIVTFVVQFVVLGVAGLVLLLVGWRRRHVRTIGAGMVFAGLSIAGLSFDIYRVSHTSDIPGMPNPTPTLVENIFYGVFLGVGLAMAVLGLLASRLFGWRRRKDTSS